MMIDPTPITSKPDCNMNIDEAEERKFDESMEPFDTLESTAQPYNYAQLREILCNANSFEWDSTIHPTSSALDPSKPTVKNPNKFLTPSCFWSMTNAQYFPYASFYLATDDEANESMMDDITQSA